MLSERHVNCKFLGLGKKVCFFKRLLETLKKHFGEDL